MSGLQVTASGLERSGLPGHDAVSMVQTVRYVGQYSFMFKGQEIQTTYTASYSRNLKSRYVNTP